MAMATRRFLLGSILTLAALARPSDARADITSGNSAELQIVAPMDGDTLHLVPFDVIVFVDEPFVEVATLELRVDGTTVATLTESPWTFPDIELAEGMHELVVVAIAPDASETSSEAITIALLEGGAPPKEESSKGCAVTTASSLGGVALTGLVLFGLVALRRRS